MVEGRTIDALGRTTAVTAAHTLGTVTLLNYSYDALGNLKTRTDPLNHTTALTYDALNRLSQVTNALTGITAYGYDPLDQVTGITDPRQAATHYTVVGTCRHLGLDPFAYLRDVLPKLHALGDRPTDDQLTPLLPDRWLAERAANTSAQSTAA